MLLSPFIDNLSLIAAWPHADATARARYLRRANLIADESKPGERWEVTPRDVAIILVALLATSRANRCVDGVRDYAALVSTSGTGVTLLDAVTTALQSVEAARPVQSVRVSRSRPIAWISYREPDSVAECIETYTVDGTPDQSEPATTELFAEIRNGAIHQLAIEIEDQNMIGEIVN